MENKVDSSGSGYEKVAGSCDGLSFYIKSREFLDEARSFLVGNKKSSPPS